MYIVKKHHHIPIFLSLKGVKFEQVKIEGSYPNRLELRIESMEYNYTSGKLTKDSEAWTKPEATKSHK